MTLEETLKQIKPLNEEKMKTARRRWDSIAKPLHSLGKMEDLITQIVGITGEEKVDLGKKALVAMCADNGVVEEGVTQTGQEVTKTVTENMTKHNATICIVPPVWSGCKASGCGNGKRHHSTYRSESYVWNPQYDERSCYGKRRSHKRN